MGYLDSQVYWESSPFGDMKVIFTLIAWAYYVGVLATNIVLGLKKHPERARIGAILALIGPAFLLLNILLSKLGGLHQYL